MPGVRIVRDVVPGGRILLRFFAIVSSDDYILKSRLKKIKKMLTKKNIKKIIIFFVSEEVSPFFIQEASTKRLVRGRFYG